jgi:hypothetical protein
MADVKLTAQQIAELDHLIRRGKDIDEDDLPKNRPKLGDCWLDTVLNAAVVVTMVVACGGAPLDAKVGPDGRKRYTIDQLKELRKKAVVA